MPTVLITGINGFVAVHTAAQFLENGWNVRGTVRSASKGDTALALPVFKPYQGKIDYVIVEDLIEGDFTEALKGVDAIAHCASPWHFNGKAWSEYRDPAVKGTTNVLEQAAKLDSVKAVAIVSSFAAIGDFSTPSTAQKGKKYTEDDWLPWTAEDCEKGESPIGNQGMWYCTSKKLAEQAAFETQKRVGAKYTLASINPPAILGPAIHYASAEGIEKSDVSTQSTWASLAAGKDSKPPPTPFPSWADVRSVASALYLALTKQKSGRFIVYDGESDYELLPKIARKQRPDLDKCIPFVAEDAKTPSDEEGYTLDPSKGERELGLKHISLEQMVSDVVTQLEKIGAMKA